MATTTHGDPQPIDLNAHDEQDEESWDENIEALLAVGDVEGARAEFERLLLVSVNSGVVEMTPAKWEELRAELHLRLTDLQDEEHNGFAESGREKWREPRPGRPGHTVDTLLDQGDIAGAKEELARLLLAGMTSANAVAATPEFFDSARDRLRRKAELLAVDQPA